MSKVEPLRELARTLALCKAYEVAGSTCLGCGLPATRFEEDSSNPYCDGCTPAEQRIITEGGYAYTNRIGERVEIPVSKRPALFYDFDRAAATRRLMLIAKGE